MNRTWKIIIGNIKAAKADKARCARECAAITTGGYKSIGGSINYGTISADYSIEAKIIAKIVESNSDHFANEFYAKMKKGIELSDKQSYALACAFNAVEITLADVKKAIADTGWDIEEDFMFDGSMDD
jgi:hypothetical protein